MVATNSLKDILDHLGLKQTELARLLDVSSRTVSLWATGETALPGPVAAYLRVVRSRPDVLHQELKRLEGREKMLDEGIYGFTYKGEHLGVLDGDSALAVLRNGKILGSDRAGGVFAGSYACVGGVSSVVPVDLHIRGCPPSPVALLQGLIALVDSCAGHR